MIRGARRQAAILTFTDFDVDPGAEVEVWLDHRAGPRPATGSSCGGLKGNVGNQQYEIPAGADLNRHGTVMLYCTPFTVRIAVAELMPPSSRQPEEAGNFGRIRRPGAAASGPAATLRLRAGFLPAVVDLQRLRHLFTS